MEHPAGESKDGPLNINFDRRLKLDFHGIKITSDAGLLAYWELDHVLGLTDLAGTVLSDCRRGENTRHVLTSLREKLVKIGAKIVTHARYVTFQMPEVTVLRGLFEEILRLIARLRPSPVLA